MCWYFLLHWYWYSCGCIHVFSMDGFYLGENECIKYRFEMRWVVLVGRLKYSHTHYFLLVRRTLITQSHLVIDGTRLYIQVRTDIPLYCM